ncbi:MAG: hypothetical protein ACQ9MH_21870 [Nitrospinales bacterium]
MSGYSRGERYAQSLVFLRFTNEAREGLFTGSSKKLIADLDSSRKILEYFDADNADRSYR